MESLDVLVAALIVLSFSALALHTYAWMNGFHAFTAHSQGCFLDALRFSDFLIQDPDGLALRNGPLVLDHVVDCTKIPAAHARLSHVAPVFVSCGSISAGQNTQYDATVVRYAYWKDHGVVSVVVKTCPR